MLQILNIRSFYFSKILNKHVDISYCKVETLGDAVYMVAGGVPDRKPNHAESVAGLALELVDVATTLMDPVTKNRLELRAGEVC